MASHRLTLLLAEVIGDLGMRRRVGDGEAGQALERCANRLQRVLQACGGRPLHSGSTRLVAVLPDPEAACTAAYDMQQRIAALPPVGGHKLALRVAVHAALPGAAADEPDRLAMADSEKMLQLGGPGETIVSTVILLHLPERLASDWESLASAELPGLVLYRRRFLPAGPAMPQAAPGSGERLCLRHRDQLRVVDAQTPVLSIGRDPACLLQVGDSRVSRRHARVEQRGRDYFLVDSSTNGSFVRVEGGREMLLRHGELMLAGSGSICLGASANDPGAARIDFEHLD
ncbi:FHA domain-containing protein [Dechloromonas sp. ZY10]|uniref:FHA domain-containing protein n=1 Tax=Dechloromonas aquae TaxID=2664436 RepID=UPI0035297249